MNVEKNKKISSLFVYIFNRINQILEDVIDITSTPVFDAVLDLGRFKKDMEQFDADHKIEWKIRKIKGMFRFACTHVSECLGKCIIQYGK